MAQWYSGHVKIDKVSAPGATPYYRSAEPDEVFYDGSRVCYLPVRLKKGKTAKVVFERTFIEPEQFTDIMLLTQCYTRHLIVEVKVPRELAGKITVEGFKLPEGMNLESSQTSDGGIIYKVEATDVDKYTSEKGAPAPNLTAPRLLIRGLFPDLPSLYSFLKGYIGDEEADADISALASRLAAGAPDDRARIDSVARWVQSNIRYLAIEHGEYGLRPVPAAEVLKSRAGDCKGVSNLSKALLRSCGLDARLAWIGTSGSIPYSWSTFPSLASGNRMIAAVVLPDTIVYVDGTAKWSVPGEIPYGIRGREVIVEDGGSFILTKTPSASPHPDRIALSAKLAIDGTSLKGHIGQTLSGSERLGLLNTYYDLKKPGRDNFLNACLTYPSKTGLASQITFPADVFAPEITISGTVTEHAVHVVGEKQYVSLNPIRDRMTYTLDLKDRKNGLYIYAPHTYTADFTLEIPEGMSVGSLPADFSVSNDWFDASITYRAEESAVRCLASISHKKQFTPLSELGRRNDAIKKIIFASESKIVLISTP